MAYTLTDPPRAAGPNNTWPGGRAAPAWAASQSHLADSSLDLDRSERGERSPQALARWMGWRLRLLVGCALLGCLGIAALIQALAAAPHADTGSTWGIDADGHIELTASSDPLLQPHLGKVVIGTVAADGRVVLADALAMQRSSRWVVDDAERARQQTLHAELRAVMASSEVKIFFADGSKVSLHPAARGIVALPALFWLLCVFALALYLVTVVVVLADPSGRNLVYAVMALCQSGNLLLIGVEAALLFGLPAPLSALSLPLHVAFDLVTIAAMVNAACLHPRRLPGSGWIALLAWAAAVALIAAAATGQLGHLWWWVQGTVLGFGLLAIGLLSWSYQIEPHPVAILLRRFGIVLALTWTVLTLALAAAERLPVIPHSLIDTGPTVWYMFLSSMLMLVPFLAKSRHFMREFSLLAAVSTIATSLDLLFVAAFSLGQFASLTLSLFVSLSVYAGMRQWILSRLLGSAMLTTERMFEQLYRIAREVEAHPDRASALLVQLLNELFEPLECNAVDRVSRRTRVAGDGSSMLVPVPVLGGETAPSGSVVIRFAHRGRRLFTSEDARLTDRVVEQLRRAVRFDKAVEQGRSEERLRLAQDLHDDIGARLLTLMYKAQSPEMEDYVRHTLQDLKTLTRGLAASNHPLSHAAAEWKSDLAHRLDAAHVEFDWRCSFDDDIVLGVGQWSALTRILRELVSNVIAHSQATRLAIAFTLENDRIELTITDDGIGRDPRAWAHGLGLGGIRKRVKQLGGEVEWREVRPHGISCRVVIEDLSQRWQLERTSGGSLTGG